MAITHERRALTSFKRHEPAPRRKFQTVNVLFRPCIFPAVDPYGLQVNFRKRSQSLEGGQCGVYFRHMRMAGLLMRMMKRVQSGPKGTPDCIPLPNVGCRGQILTPLSLFTHTLSLLNGITLDRGVDGGGKFSHCTNHPWRIYIVGQQPVVFSPPSDSSHSTYRALKPSPPRRAT